MGWIRYPIALDDHRALLTFSRHDCINTFGTMSRFDQLTEETNPQELEEAIRYLIEDTRPDLIDCTIEWINYNYQMNCLEFGVCHPSLEPSVPGCELKRVPLVMVKDISFSFPLKGDATVTIVRQLTKEEVEHARKIIDGEYRRQCLDDAAAKANFSKQMAEGGTQ